MQLLGSEPDLMAGNAVKAVELGALAIDINFGCPAKTVNSHRGGSVLLTEPETLVSNHPCSTPSRAIGYACISKIRLGYEDTSLTQEIGDAVQSANASWLTIHARTKPKAINPQPIGS